MKQIAKFFGGPKDGMTASRKMMPQSVLFVDWGEEYMVAVEGSIHEGDLQGIPCVCYEMTCGNDEIAEYEYKMSFV